ncbi:hypothetical protein GXU05_005038 [Escherichia coli]|nr:hypothetical protein [Escherichia coli]EFI4238374.1 hypothetical protein [Escherichia coli]EFJ0062619.1 hypothetical protein [Escherichia coli]TJR31680.1 hypothetical protein C9Z43_25405 [Escherichia coli]
MRFLTCSVSRTHETDRHSVSCIVMQRTENDSDAFFRFPPRKTSLFASESRSARFSGTYNYRIINRHQRLA